MRRYGSIFEPTPVQVTPRRATVEAAANSLESTRPGAKVSPPCDESPVSPIDLKNKQLSIVICRSGEEARSAGSFTANRSPRLEPARQLASGPQSPELSYCRGLIEFPASSSDDVASSIDASIGDTRLIPQSPSNKPDSSSDVALSSSQALLNSLYPLARDLTRFFRFAQAPPTAEFLLKRLDVLRMPRIVYQEPFYGRAADVPARAAIFAARSFKIPSRELKSLPGFHSGDVTAPLEPKPGLYLFGLANKPPLSFEDAEQWIALQRQDESRFQSPSTPPGKPAAGPPPRSRPAPTQIEGPTPRPFKYTQNSQPRDEHECQFLSLLSLEVHAQSRGDLLPDPAQDPIELVVYCSRHEQPVGEQITTRTEVGSIAVSTSVEWRRLGVPTSHRHVDVPDEKALLEALIAMIVAEDPDILLGFEIQQNSWGYVVDRAFAAYGLRHIVFSRSSYF